MIADNLNQFYLSLPILFTSLAAAIVSVINAVRTKDVQRKVDTGNGKTIGRAVDEIHSSGVRRDARDGV